jgi:hypothetical protein
LGLLAGGHPGQFLGSAREFRHSWGSWQLGFLSHK